MVKFINKLLFNVNTQKDTSSDRFITKVMSGVPIFTKDTDGDIKERSRIDILTIDSEEKKIDKGSSYIKFVEKKGKNGKVYNNAFVVTEGNAISDKIKGNRVYCIAVPFNGTISPIKVPEGVNVYAGAILLSRKFSIPYENRKYSRIIYLVITVDPELHKDTDLNIDFIAHSQFCKKDSSGVYEAVDGKSNKDTIQVTFRNDSRRVRCYHEVIDGKYSEIKEENDGKRVFEIIKANTANRIAEINKQIVELKD